MQSPQDRQEIIYLILNCVSEKHDFSLQYLQSRNLYDSQHLNFSERKQTKSLIFEKGNISERRFAG